MWFGGIAAAVIKRLSKRAHDAEREQARRQLRAYAYWHLKRGEGDGNKAWERDRKLIGHPRAQDARRSSSRTGTLVGTPTRPRRRDRGVRAIQPHAASR